MNVILSSLVGNTFPLWDNLFFYLFLSSVIIFSILLRYCMKKHVKKNEENKLTQQQHTARIDALRKEHCEVVDDLKEELLKKEEDINRQWMISEKEAIRVLDNISQLLELSDNFGRLESQKILDKIDELKNQQSE